MRFSITIILLITCFGLCSCADLGTVSRTTVLPSGIESDTGLAIHLDAQQRLVLVKASTYCAEPSPDALASYAASLGLGLGRPGKDAASVAQAVQSNVASLGLRTQSITIMRDALYRVCEAIANGVVTKVGAITLLTRAQNMTAVVLAIEQLTGAVSASPVILTSDARANASAILMANQELLEAAETDVKEKKENLRESQQELKEIEAAVKEKQSVVKKAQDALIDSGDDGDVLNIRSETLEAATQDRNNEQTKFDAAKRTVQFNEGLLEEAEKNRDAIRNIREAGLTQVTATAVGVGQFGNTPTQRNQLDAESTKEIARAIKEMVKHAIDKDYTVESCMALITDISSNSSNESNESNNIIHECTKLVSANLRKETMDIETSSFDKLDAAGKRILKQLEAGERDKLNQLLNETFGASVTLTTVLYGGAKFAPLRESLANKIEENDE